MSRHSASALVLSIAAVFAVAAAPVTASDPGLRHTLFMAGSVLESSAGGIYLCIGTPDGARIGQRLDVVRVTRDQSLNPKQGARFLRKTVGSVQIDAIVNQHFAQATVTSGQVRRGDVVRLSAHADNARKP